MASLREGRLHGALGALGAHLRVDMQRIFDQETPWRTPWLRRVLPNIVEIVAAEPDRTVFNDPRRASEAGREGGEASHAARERE